MLPLAIVGQLYVKDHLHCNYTVFFTHYFRTSGLASSGIIYRVVSILVFIPVHINIQFVICNDIMFDQTLCLPLKYR